MGNSSMSVTPSAARLTGSLRDIGYDFSSAIADLIDNSITAGASRIDVIVEFAGESSRVFIADDGIGMTPNGLIEALRFGSRRLYGMGDLGRYGLGLKTASLSQSRSLTVVTRRAQGKRLIHTRQLDLDLIAELDDWLVVEPSRTEAVGRARRMLEDSQGTVVVWEKLDRVLPEKNSAGGWARRRIETLTQKTEDHLAMVFHRFLDDNAIERKLTITVNGKKLSPWDPFATSEPGTKALPLQRFEIVHGEVSGWVSLRRYVLPGRDRFSSPSEFDRLSGPLKWNRQQGIYTYRANRLVQWGGWSGIRGIDEHTKLARASIDFDTDLDEAFNINVAKMRVSIPPQLRQMLERPINEVCMLADDTYRKTAKRRGRRSAPTSDGDASVQNVAEFGLALKSAAVQAGEYAALKKIAAELRSSMPDVASSLGL
jgi:hypothetical protein